MMRARIVITDERGDVYQGELTLVSAPVTATGRRTPRRKEASQHTVQPELDFTLPVRAFVKRYATATSLGGRQKFTLLVARLAQGKAGVLVALSEISSAWNKMTGLLGGRYNPAHSTRAKEKGWVDAPKPGFYTLRPSWVEALESE
jgi:hypothetical protein